MEMTKKKKLNNFFLLILEDTDFFFLMILRKFNLFCSYDLHDILMRYCDYSQMPS